MGWFVELAAATAPATSAAGAVDYGPLPVVLFYAFAGMVVVAALGVALARNIVRAAVGLLFALAGMSGLYFLLQAEFLAAVQLVVYVGGTLILIIFGVMLTSKAPNATYAVKRWEVIWAGVVGVLVTVPLVVLMWGVWGGQAMPAATGEAYAVDQLGRALLDPAGYLAPFELVSVVLLAVMIGAAYLAKSRKAGRGEAKG